MLFGAVRRAASSLPWRTMAAPTTICLSPTPRLSAMPDGQPDGPPGVHLVRTDENVDEIDALAARLGGRVGLGGVLGDLDRRGRRGFAPGRAVRRAITWDAADRRDLRWWPQGISTSADASDTEDVEGRRVLGVTWDAKGPPRDPPGDGPRVTLL